jgi:hypothetical protein
MWIIDCVKLEIYTNNFGEYKVEEKLRLRVREQRKLNTNILRDPTE